MHIVTGGQGRTEIDNPESIPRLIREMEAEGRDSVVLEKCDGIHMSILIDAKYYVIIFEDYKTGRGILNASNPPEESTQTIVLSAGGTPTPIPQNMCLTKEIALEAIRHFCR